MCFWPIVAGIVFGAVVTVACAAVIVSWIIGRLDHEP